jgi:mannose-6-phosphate isomerase-like protein (cupin superfamily)
MPDIYSQPIHLGLGAKAIVEPEFTGMEWYEAYEDRHNEDGAEGRLVGMYRFTEDWDSWEMHPGGHEVVICVAGAMTLHQELPDGTTARAALGPGDYAINPPGAWHTADVAGEATALFITVGLGTQHRPRERS